MHAKDRMSEGTATEQTLALAINDHAAGRLDEAARGYWDVLARQHDHPAALHYCGILLHQTQQTERGIDMMKRAAELDPHNADWHNGLGNVLAECNEVTGAINAFSRAVAINPRDEAIWNNLGALHNRTGDGARAADAFERALAINPESIDALNNLGTLRADQGRAREATEFFCRAFVLGPTEHKPKHMLGIAYYRLGRYAEAADVYRAWIAEDPDHPTPRHLLAGCSGENIPARAEDRYVELVFDEYAENFDSKLTETLGYKVPWMIERAVRERMTPNQTARCIDLGCGTGLCGPLLRPFARQLVGVDLSQRMLERAHSRDVYDELHRDELTRFLQQQPPASADLLVAADTLIYIGDMSNLFQAAARALHTGGRFIFSVETHEATNGATDYKLLPNGRYSHTLDYVAAAAMNAGFAVESTDAIVIRTEFEIPVTGTLFVCRKSG